MKSDDLTPGEHAAFQRMQNGNFTDLSDALTRMAEALEALSTNLQRVAARKHALQGAEEMAGAMIARAMKK